jgi:hypothetical protein
LADATAVPHVLVGNYGLCLLRNLNGQLGRRTTDVHLRRYDATRPQDVADFRDVVLSFQGRLPLAEPPNLVDDWEHLYVRSVGCVGLLKAWLTRALGRALECGESTLRPADLRRAAPPPSKSQVVLQEALEGERLLAELDPAADLRAAEATLRGLLGLDTRSGPGGHAAPADGPAPVSMGSRRRVGQRRPTRDPVRPNAGRERLG